MKNLGEVGPLKGRPKAIRCTTNPQSFLNVKIAKEIKTMTQFLLFVMAILLILIFWELSKIHTRLKMGPRSQTESTKKREETTGVKVA
jgi:hypothetical protein